MTTKPKIASTYLVVSSHSLKVSTLLAASTAYQKLMPALINTKVELQTSTPVASSDFMDQTIE
jgi:hypothetical protein